MTLVAFARREQHVVYATRASALVVEVDATISEQTHERPAMTAIDLDQLKSGRCRYGERLMAGKALICGSIAYDSIMVFDGRFKDHILPDKIHMLNVSFLVPQLRREFGGCAGNIAYNLRLLGDAGYPMATVGRDFAPYQQWMRDTQVPQDYVRVVDTEHTAQAFITTDPDDNQITAFHPGAMQLSHLNTIPANAGITLGHRRAGWPRWHGAALRRLCRGRHSVHLRSGPGSADVQWR